VGVLLLPAGGRLLLSACFSLLPVVMLLLPAGGRLPPVGMLLLPACFLLLSVGVLLLPACFLLLPVVMLLLPACFLLLPVDGGGPARRARTPPTREGRAPRGYIAASVPHRCACDPLYDPCTLPVLVTRAVPLGAHRGGMGCALKKYKRFFIQWNCYFLQRSNNFLQNLPNLQLFAYDQLLFEVNDFRLVQMHQVISNVRMHYLVLRNPPHPAPKYNFDPCWPLTGPQADLLKHTFFQ
jgi:hypothetical protein